MKINTPFGKISILIDGNDFKYTSKKLKLLEDAPHVKGRYLIEIDFTPDGKKHTISCVLNDMKNYKSSQESGEDVQSIVFYNEENWALEIGVRGEQWIYCLKDGIWQVDESFWHRDYDIEYLKKGISYTIMPDTVTDKYIFCFAWIDEVDYDNLSIDRCDELWKSSYVDFL